MLLGFSPKGPFVFTLYLNRGKEIILRDRVLLLRISVMNVRSEQRIVIL